MKQDIIDTLLLGHNQFFGISHLSSEKGIAREQYFSKIENIIELIKYAASKGINGLMLSTHDRAKEIANAIRSDKALAQDIRLYILLPYMAKYVRMANQKGLVNMVADILKQASWSERFSIGLSAGVGFLKKDQLSSIQALIDIELLPFKGLNTEAIFLHNSLTDLGIGFGASEIIRFYIDYIEKKHKTQPGFCTLSSGQLMQFLKKEGIENPLIMAPFNPIGFQMSPSKQVCEQLLADYPSRIIAMSTLAAGQVKPTEAATYLSSFPQIKSAVIGASSKSHIDGSFDAFAYLKTLQ